MDGGWKDIIKTTIGRFLVTAHFNAGAVANTLPVISIPRRVVHPTFSIPFSTWDIKSHREIQG